MTNIIETIHHKFYECKSKLHCWDSVEFVLVLGVESKQTLYKEINNSLTPMVCTGVSEHPDMFMGMKIKTINFPTDYVGVEIVNE
jgi:hypothetical protein